MNILVTLDRNYLMPFEVMLCSLLINHPGETMDVYLISQDVTQADLGAAQRLCARFGARLHLIEPLGFRLTAGMIKRAAMDYWDQVELYRYRDYQHFTDEIRTEGEPRIWYVTTKADQAYTDVSYRQGDYLMFGKESAGIPEEILVDYEATCIRIPMLPAIRSLNLSNSVAVVLYEALRQTGFSDMQMEGELHRLQWKETNE